MSTPNDTVKRKPVSFTAGENRLYGVLHQPASGKDATRGVIMLSAGLKNRTGYARLYVALADHIASQGFPAMRFDYHGCGESDGHLGPTGAWEETHADINEQVLMGYFEEDVAAALSEFKRQTGCSEIMFFGLCSGANLSIEAGAKFPEVYSVVLTNMLVAIDSTKRREKRKGGMNLFQEQFMWQAYLKKVFSIKAWARVLGGKSDFKSISYLVKKKLLGSKPKPAAAGATEGAKSVPSDDGFEFNFELLDTFETYWKTGRPVNFFFSENDPIRVNYETYFEQLHGIEILKRNKDLWHKIVFKDANHPFVQTEWREQLFERVVECARKEILRPTQV